MQPMVALWKRELAGYFFTPVAYVFLVVFLVMMAVFTFHLGGFYTAGDANLQPFFTWHLWVYVFFVPALSMRLWAEERRHGTMELLMTLPVTSLQMVLGKFFAAWSFLGIALLATLPMWFTVSYLGDPDHGVIFASYLGSFVMAGGYLALGSCISALTRNQVIAFVLSMSLCFIFTVSGYPLVTDFFNWLPDMLVFWVSYISFSSHFDLMMRGIVSLDTLLYVVAFMAFWLTVNVAVVTYRRA